MAENIGFIGLGNMGYPMAGNIRTKMAPNGVLVINDVVDSACTRFVEEFGKLGPIKVVSSPKEVASEAGTVISMVPSGKQARMVYLSAETGIMAAPDNEDRLLLECSTIDIKTAKEIGGKIMEAEKGRYIDAPVSGGVAGAVAGVLSFMVGSEASTDADAHDKVNRAKSIISMMADPKKIFFTGKLGTGLGAKIANNYSACCIMLVTAEAMSIGVRCGVEPKTLFDIIRASSGSSWHLDVNPCMPDIIPTAPSSNGYTPAFKPFMVVKDLSLGIEAANDTGIKPVCAEAAVGVYQKVAEHPRYKDLDCTSVWLLINEEGLPA